MPQKHSDLEVVAKPWSDLQVDPNSTAPEAVPHEAYPNPLPQYVLGTYSPPTPQQRRLCGQRVKTFWIILAIGSVIVVGAIIGGVVGGLQASKSKPDSTTSSVSPSSSASHIQSPAVTSIGTKTKASEISTSISIATLPTGGGLRTLYYDCPSSNNTVYESQGKSEYQFVKRCGESFAGTPNAYVNQQANSLNECIDLCIAYNQKNEAAIKSGDSEPCSSVCWRNGQDSDDFPTQCFSGTYKNATAGGFKIQNELKCDSAAWINPS